MPKNKPPKIIVIVGPTASGKSDLAIKIAKKFNGEIISADSRQVYRGMDIGTGKIKKDSIKYKVLSIRSTKKDPEYYSDRIRHHLIDVASPKKQFTVDDFKKLGQKALNDILSRGPDFSKSRKDLRKIEDPRFASSDKSRKANRDKIPIIVGGTGFYIDVLLGRMSVAEVPPNPKLRKHFDKLSVEHLFKMLQKLDPRRARTIESKNKRRLIRALEIVLTTGKPVPKIVSSIKYQVLWLGLKPKNLETRIKKRLDARLKQGMVKEVKRLLRSDVSKKGLYDFGLEYRWVNRYLNKKINHKEMKEGLFRDIIKYSKRQMTWFKRNKEVKWFKNQSGVIHYLLNFTRH